MIRKTETHEFDVVDIGHGRSSRSVKVCVYLNRAFNESEKGFTDEEISTIKEAEKAFVNVIENVLNK